MENENSPFMNVFLAMLKMSMFKTRQPINGTAYIDSFVTAIEMDYRPTRDDEVAVWNLDLTDVNLVVSINIREELYDIGSAVMLDTYIIFIILIINIVMSLPAIGITIYTLTAFRWVKFMTASLRIKYSFAIANIIKLILSSTTSAVFLYKISILFFDTYINIYSIIGIYLRISKNVHIIHVLNLIRIYFSEVLYSHLILLSIHDFVLIIFSLKYKYVFVNRNTNVALIVVWLIPFVKDLLLHVANFPVLFDCFTVYFPSVMVIYIYTHIIIFLRIQRAKWANMEEGNTYRNCGGQTLKKFKSHVKAIHTSLYMLAVFLIFRLVGYLISICVRSVGIPNTLASVNFVLMSLSFIPVGIVDSISFEGIRKIF